MGLNEINPYDELMDELLPDYPEESPDAEDIETEEDEYDDVLTEENDPFDKGPDQLQLNPLWLWDGESLCWSSQRLPRQRPRDWELFRQALEKLLIGLPQVAPFFMDLENLEGLLQTKWLKELTGSDSLKTANLEGQALTDLEGRIFPLDGLLAGQGSRQESWPKRIKEIWLAEIIIQHLGPDAFSELSWEQVKDWLPQRSEQFCDALNGVIRSSFALGEDRTCLKPPGTSTLQRKWLPEIRKAPHSR